MKKFKLFSGIGLLLAFFLSIIYLSVADEYGLWTEKTLYASLLCLVIIGIYILFLSLVIIGIYILFLRFCAWLISDGIDN